MCTQRFIPTKIKVGQNGTGTISPCTLRPHMLRTCMFCPRTSFPNVFTSLYVSFLRESQPTELHQPRDWLSI